MLSSRLMYMLKYPQNLTDQVKIAEFLVYVALMTMGIRKYFIFEVGLILAFNILVCLTGNNILNDTVGDTSAQRTILEQRKNLERAQYFYNLGNTFTEQGEFVRAIESYKLAIVLNQEFAAAYNNMGICMQFSNRLDEAIDTFNQALLIDPKYASALTNLGNALHSKGKGSDAVTAYRKAISLNSNNSEAYQNLGTILQEQGSHEEALSAYAQAIFVNPENAQARNNFGNLLKAEGRMDEALSAYKKAISIKPDFAEAYNNIGILLQQRGEPIEAIKAYEKAISLKPDFADAHKCLSFSLMQNDRILEGLEQYEWRWKSPKNSRKKRNFSQPLWDGQQKLLEKRILIWSEQGIGDIINWSSRLTLLQSQTLHCILECPEKLVPLLSRSFPSIEVIAEDKSRDSLRNDFDVHLPLGSLYRHFSSEVLRNSKPAAFLQPDVDRIKFWEGRLKSLGKGPYVGISWKSSNMSQERMLNYAPLAEWSPIFNIRDIIFVNLQYVDFEEDIKRIEADFGVVVHNFDDLDHYNDLDDVAALCSALDAVVSTKVTVPFISAGVGTVTKLANWRQSPWNNVLLNPPGPLINIFEKNTWETWEEVFRAIAGDLVTLRPKVQNNMWVG